MAKTYLGRANFQPVVDTGIARAKKLADIYIKSHTDSGGSVVDPQVYQYAIDTYLTPFAEDLSIQQKIEGYSNNVKSLGSKNFDQSITLASFKREITASLYTSDSRLVRDPWTLAQYTSEELDKALVSINTAIDYLDAKNKSTDQLVSYRNDLNKMAGAQRELVNNLAQGTSNPNLDGYGYYVKTNPANGALVGAALLPTFAAPPDITEGSKKLENNLTIGKATIPVYLPANKNADGEWEARLYNDVWKGTGDTALTKDSGNNFKNGGFDISNAADFPIKSFDLQSGQFGRQLSGVDTGGKSVYTYYYRGSDGKVRSIDQNSISMFQQDPLMAKKLNDFVPTLGAEDVRNFGSVTPMDAGVIKTDKTAMLQQQVKDNQALSDTANANLKKWNTGALGAAADVGGVIQGGVNAVSGAVKSVGGFFSNMFNRKNQPSTPNPAPVSSGGSYSTPDVVASGSSFFQGKVK